MSAGKGDTYRPVDRKKWNENYERIYGKSRKKDEGRESVESGRMADDLQQHLQHDAGSEESETRESAI